MKKIVFLDRDGIINEDTGYVHKISDFKLKKNIITLLLELKNLNYEFIIITNQSGIARGYFSETDLIKLHNHLLKILNKEGINILDIFYCPHHIDGVVPRYKLDCRCRKPNVGMIDKAIEKYPIDLNLSVLIGDKESDILAGFKKNIKTILISKNNFNSKANLILDHLNVKLIITFIKQIHKF